MTKTNKKSIIVAALSFLFLICLSLSFVVFKASATGELIAPVMQNGAEVRDYTGDGKSGLRFTAFVDDSYFTNGVLNDDAVAGIIITKGDVAAETLTHESNKAGGAYEGKVLDIKANVWASNRDIEGAKAFNAVVYNIPTSAYASDLTARAYVGVYNQTKGEYEYAYSENVCTRSIAEVASKVLAAGNNVESLIAYVDGANADFAVNGNSEEAVELSLAVGQTVKIQPTNQDLAVALTTDSGLLEVGYNGLTVKGYSADANQAVVTAKLGSKVKNITITVKNEFKDDNLAENLIADFDESFYPGYGIKVAPSVTHTYMAINYKSAEAAKEEGVDATSGVVALKNYGNYDAFVIPFGKTLNVTEISGIYIKIWVGAKAAGSNSAWLTINGVEKKVSNDAWTKGINLVANSWNYIYVSRERLRNSSGYNATQISELTMYLYGAAAEWYYIDEVGLLDAVAEENELINFDSEADIQTVFPWSNNTVAWLSASDSTCPTGATGGVLKITATGAAEVLMYFKRDLDMSQVSKIIVRAYITSNIPLRWWSVNSTGGYSTANWTINAHVGQFYDYEIDVASQWGTTDSSVSAIRLHPNTADVWYIDSITYIAK